MTDLIQINQCDTYDLRQLPGVGRKLAQAICIHRQFKGNLTPISFADIPHLRFTKELQEMVGFDEHTAGDQDARTTEESVDEDSDLEEPGGKQTQKSMSLQGEDEQQGDMAYWKIRAIQTEAQLKLEQARFSQRQIDQHKKDSARKQDDFASYSTPKLKEKNRETYDQQSSSGYRTGKIPRGRPDNKLQRFDEMGDEETGYDQKNNRDYGYAVKPNTWRENSPGWEREAPKKSPYRREEIYAEDEPAFPNTQISRYSSSQKTTDAQKKMVNIPKAITYDGRSSWQAFYTKFSKYAEVQHWSAKECKDYLCWCLDGKASEFYALLIERNRELEFFDLVRKLEKRFGYKDLPETAHIQFMQARQLPQESLDEWADKVLTLATRAFQSLPDEHMYTQAVMRFCQGSVDKEAGQHAANLRPQSIEEAMDKIRWFQHTNQAIYGRSSRREIKYVSSDIEEDAPVRVRVTTQTKPNLETRINNLESQMGAIHQNVEKLTVGFQKIFSSWTNRRNSYSRSPSPARSNNCYKCGGTGHFKRDCPANDVLNRAASPKAVTFKEASLNGGGSTTEA